VCGGASDQVAETLGAETAALRPVHPADVVAKTASEPRLCEASRNATLMSVLMQSLLEPAALPIYCVPGYPPRAHRRDCGLARFKRISGTVGGRSPFVTALWFRTASAR
jgi:hypothetical protein